MADVVVYEDSPLAQYLQEIQGEHLQHATVPVHDPEPQPAFIGYRLAHNAVDMLTHLVEYVTHTFSSPTTDSEDNEFEERFKYLICTSPFLNRTVTLHTHERGKRNEVPMNLDISRFHLGRAGYMLGFGTLATLMAQSALNRTRFARLAWFRPFIGRSAAVSVALASSAWMLRILQRRNIHATQTQALRLLQLLVGQCQTLDAKVNRAIMIIQEIELVSRGYRLSTPLAPISRIEQATKSRRCNIVRAQLVAALTKSGALFQRTTETLQSHIDPTRLNTLLDMYNVKPSSRPGSPQGDEDVQAGRTTPRPQHRNTNGHNGHTNGHGRHSHTLSHDSIIVPDNDHQNLTASPTSELPSPLPSSFSHHRRQHSTSKRRSGIMNGSSRPNSRPSSFHEASQQGTFGPRMNGLNGNGLHGLHGHRHRTSWSASEGDDSDTGSMSISPRSSHSFSRRYDEEDVDDLTVLASTPEMTSLERLRKNFQRMHAHRREFLCELLSIRRKSRKGRQGLSAVMDYDRNWTVVRDVLQEGLNGIQSVVDELSKVLDSELYTLPKIETFEHRTGNSTQDKQLQPFVQRLALLEQHVRGIQAKLFICSEDIRDTAHQEPSENDSRRLLEVQYESISQDISMMASEWQLGKVALTRVFEPTTVMISRSAMFEEQASPIPQQTLGINDEFGHNGPIIDSEELLEDHQRLMALAAKREETWEASTEADLPGEFLSSRAFVGPDGVKMSRAERIQFQKYQRELEEAKKEKRNETTRMVHELKNVLGQRRHLREGEEDEDNGHHHQEQEEHEQAPTQQQLAPKRPSLIPTERPSVFSKQRGFSARFGNIDHVNGNNGPQQHRHQHSHQFQPHNVQQLSLEEEPESTYSLGGPSSFYSEGSSSFVHSFMEDDEQVEESYTEITGVGEADEEDVPQPMQA
ncbi:Mysoin-binding motif of peroxisomes-domain-containing protein [Mortierella sp. GBAus27b]|nr:hypothetical protein BGX31_000324 [Mortierella sp. GBA43]KAI8355856.1 Mysoin-binding motif of peroxisomes-domain-containing protein [Mortierella sp. GBAus27b]